MDEPKSDKTVIIAFKPSKSEMSNFFQEVKSALKSENVEKINELMENLTESGSNDKIIKTTRDISQSNDEDEEAYKGEVQTERSFSNMQKLWKEFVKKMIDSTPDPVVSQHILQKLRHSNSI